MRLRTFAIPTMHHHYEYNSTVHYHMLSILGGRGGGGGGHRSGTLPEFLVAAHVHKPDQGIFK